VDLAVGDSDDIARCELAAPSSLDLTVDADHVGVEKLARATAGVDGADQLQQLTEPDPALADLEVLHDGDATAREPGASTGPRGRSTPQVPGSPERSPARHHPDG